MNPEDRADLQLVEELQAGNLDALGKIINKYQNAFYKLAYRIILNHQDAEDIVQDSFIKIYENINRYDKRYRFFSWASTIVVNSSINKHKAKKVKLKHLEKSAEQTKHKTESTRIFKEIADKEKTEIARKLLKKLPFEYRICLILRAYEELSYDEISNRLGISVGTVMSRISRGRKKINELLKKYT